MSEKTTDIQKQILKTYHKINGIVGSITIIKEGIVELVLHKDGKTARDIPMTAFGEAATELANNFKIKDRIKIRFQISGSLYNGKLYPKIIVKTVGIWKKNEIKLAKEAAIAKKAEEHQYTNHSLVNEITPQLDFDNKEPQN